MRFIPQSFIRWLNIFVILSLLGQSLLPLALAADAQLAIFEQAVAPPAVLLPDASLQPLLVNIPVGRSARQTPYDYTGPYFYDTFVPSYSDAWIFTGETALNTPGRTDAGSLTLKASATAEIILSVPPNSNLTLSYWCRDEIVGPSYSRHDLYLDGEDTTPGIGANNIVCGKSWERKEQLIGAKYTADGQVSLKFVAAQLPILSTQVGLDDVLVEGTILPNDQAYSPNECPLCSNAETRHYVGGPIDTYSGNYNYQTTDIAIPTPSASLRTRLGAPLKFERSYNSHTITNTATGVYTRPLGYGWTHNYNIGLIFPGDVGGEENTITLKAARGSRLRFEDNGDGTYSPYPGVRANLTKISDTYLITAANQSVYTFGTSAGNPTRPRLLAMRNPKGNETTFTYTADRLSKVSGPSGLRWLDFAYDGQGRLNTLTDHTGRAIGYGYDAQDRLTTMTDTRGLVWTYEYTSTATSTTLSTRLNAGSGTTSLLHAVIDPEGRTLERTYYNEESKAIKQENGAGETVVEIAYPTSQVRVVREFGRVLTDTYDGRGLLISQIDAEGNEQAYGLDGNFNRTGTQDARGNQTTFARNEFGYTTALTDALGNTSVFTYSPANNLIALQDARGYVTRYTYDDSNNLTEILNPLGDTAVFTYNARGQVTAAQNQNGHITRFAYDAFGNTTAITDALGNITAFGYDALGRLITTTDALNHIIRNAYDAGDNLIRITENYTPTQPQNHQNTYNFVTRYAYDGANRPILITDTLNRVTKYDYDLAGRLSQTTENYLPGQPQNHQSEYNLITQYGYDTTGRLTSVTDTAGRQTRTLYNARNLIEQTIANYQDGIYDPAQPDEDLITRYEYDAAGNLINVIDPLGRVAHTDYDALNRIERLIQNYQPGSTAPDANLTTHYAYDATSNLSRVTNPLNQITAYQYDSLNRLDTVIENYITGMYSGIPDQDVTTRYAYDPAGNRLPSPTPTGMQPPSPSISSTAPLQCKTLWATKQRMAMTL